MGLPQTLLSELAAKVKKITGRNRFLMAENAKYAHNRVRIVLPLELYSHLWRQVIAA